MSVTGLQPSSKHISRSFSKMTLSACHPRPPAHKWASRNPAGETPARRPGGEGRAGAGAASGRGGRAHVQLEAPPVSTSDPSGLTSRSLLLPLPLRGHRNHRTAPCPTLDSGQTRRSLDELRLLGHPLPANAALLLWLTKCWAHRISSGHRQTLHSASKTAGFAAAAVSG